MWSKLSYRILLCYNQSEYYAGNVSEKIELVKINPSRLNRKRESERETDSENEGERGE